MHIVIPKRTLYTHITKELMSPFILGLLIFTFILLTNRILKLMDLVVNKGVGLDEVIKLIIYLLPSFFMLTIPMSVLLATLIALGRLSADGELIAMKASGISLYQILPPFIALCVTGFLLTNMLSLLLLPQGNRAFRNQLFSLSKRHSEANLQERIFNDDFEGLIIYINEIPGQGKHMQGIVISDKRESEVPSLIIGEEGMIISDQNEMKVTLRLFNGSIHRAANDSLTYQKAIFKTYDMNLQLSNEESENDTEVKYSEQSIAALLKLLTDQSKEKKSLIKIQTEIHKRFAFPFACVVLGLVGIPFGAYRRKGTRSYGFVLCIIILFLYYVFLNFGETMAKRGILYPALGIWLPNVVLGIIGCYLLSVVGREKPIPGLYWIDETLNRLSMTLKKRFKRQ
ncbi:MAG: LPS export ABC transporter permease LptF [Proteobacteria bacterium]|nr:LPS export ABC transporter permease LptF [Pseudomonadota bacterium]